MKKVSSVVLSLCLMFSMAGSVAALEQGGTSPGYAGEAADVFPEPDMGKAEKDSACDYGHLIGKPENAIDRAMFGERDVRILHKGDPVTMDYSPDRVNILLDAQDRVVQVTCG